jgi:uncharacterized protein
MTLFKLILIVLGTLSLCLGAIGIFVPGLPTTPFILLSAGLYVRSSNRLYQSLINNKYFGDYISKYKENKGLTIRQKILSILMMWGMIVLSCTLFLRQNDVIVLVLIIGVIGTVVMGYIIPTGINKKC